MEEKELTGRIINKFYKVYNALGYGFIESIYHNVLDSLFIKRSVRIRLIRSIRV